MSRLCPSILLIVAVFAYAADHGWRSAVPDAQRSRQNPYASDPVSSAIGAKLFSEHCAQCHGADGEGRGRKPSLRTRAIGQTTDGELFWLLANGSRRHGMPDWSRLPEQQRWHLVSYLRQISRSASSPP